jgi:hypothetical protein
MAFGETPSEYTWHSLETTHTNINYQSLADLKKFNRKLDNYFAKCGLLRLSLCSGTDTLSDKITKKVDVIYERVQEILGIHKKMKKVVMKIYSDKRQLNAAYSKLKKTGLQNYKTHRNIRAWYMPSNNTIYLNCNDLHEGMLGHEIAHYMIDHYFLIRPTKNTGEILAQHVDKNIFE